VAGPVVVPLPAKAGEKPRYRTFVAVARGPAAWYTDYVADCWVYELVGGVPLALTTVPRMVLGGRSHVHEGGVVWPCQEGAFVKLLASGPVGLEFGMGPGGPDYVARVAWYRQFEVDEPEAWLTSDKARDPVAFAGRWAFRLPGGGYVLDKAKSEYRFPVSIINLKNGSDRTMTLTVPFKGQLPTPKSNYSQSRGADGKQRWHTIGPYLLAITQLQAEGDRLSITLGMEDWSAVVEFDVSELLKNPKDAP
jgi:hypothetical protein